MLSGGRMRRRGEWRVIRRRRRILRRGWRGVRWRI